MLVAAAMLVMSASPALAISNGLHFGPHEPMPGCKAFGHAIAAEAHNKDYGRGDLARDTASGPYSYPGRMALLVFFDKEVYCHSTFSG